jgi:N utilization substance protein B
MTDTIKKPKRGDGRRLFQQMKRAGRECAVQMLYLLDASGDWEWDAERNERYWAQVTEMGDIPPGVDPDKTREFSLALFEMVLEHRDEIDKLLEQAAQNWKLSRMSVVDRNIARLGACEIKFCDDIPPVVSINEAVELAKQFGDSDSPQFVNAILDRILKS